MPATSSVYVLTKYAFLLSLSVLLGVNVVASASSSTGVPLHRLSIQKPIVSESSTNYSSIYTVAESASELSVPLWESLSTLARGFGFVLQFSAVFTTGLYFTLFGVPIAKHFAA
ncbi:UNVERIFIED_CONTAM: hypothetical protein HDU68_011567 [Siphonaria sp. JEL0065]|nr:hypothetical protein HDU68_011567 [Siphonaria sp. JEL0065]